MAFFFPFQTKVSGGERYEGGKVLTERKAKVEKKKGGREGEEGKKWDGKAVSHGFKKRSE